MTRYFGWLLATLLVITLAVPAPAQQSPSYAKDVRPFLAKYCLECHNSQSAKDGLDLETYKSLRAGSDNGEVLVPGKADSSRLVLVVEGKEQPKMPPKDAKRHPTPKELAVLRAWVAAGAKDDSHTIKVVLPDIKPRTPAAPPVAALAYSPDGSLLAAGVYKDLVLIDPKMGNVLASPRAPSPP
jgi:hypothetical protein